jgi:hypothetical protein
MKATHQQFWMAFLAVMVIAACAASQALGVTYNLIDLTLSGYDAEAYGISSNGTQQVGRFAGSTTGNKIHAVLWNSSSSNYIDLNPSGFDYSEAHGTNGTQQVGYGETSGVPHALLWNGSAGDYADLHPSGYTESYATGTNGTQQVGYSWPSRALLWNGTAESCVELHPNGFAGSRAYGISDTQQVVGKVYSYDWGGPYGMGAWHAWLWNGSAEDYVDLHPSGFEQSEADGISGSQQVGLGWLDAFTSHALVWNGDLESCVDLHPSGYAWSAALGTNGTQQVGWASGYEMPKRPIVWDGSAVGFVELSRGSLYEAWATGIDDYGNIVGVGMGIHGDYHALLWQPVPEPATISLLALGGLAMIRWRRK